MTLPALLKAYVKLLIQQLLEHLCDTQWRFVFWWIHWNRTRVNWTDISSSALAHNKLENEVAQSHKSSITFLCQPSRIVSIETRCFSKRLISGVGNLSCTVFSSAMSITLINEWNTNHRFIGYKSITFFHLNFSSTWHFIRRCWSPSSTYFLPPYSV